MDFTRVRRTVTIVVADHKSLLLAWRMHGGPRPALSLRFIVAKPLTDSQFRRLPRELKPLIDSPDDSIVFLEWLYSLEDPRD
jgi:hypothetical protein